MNIKYNIEKLTLLLSDISNVINTAVSIFDKDYNFLCSNLGESMSSYCKTVRSNQNLKVACYDCDRVACQKCQQLGEGFSYKCHANIYETITPVLIEDTIVGYIIFGQYRQEDDFSQIYDFAVKHDIEPNKFVADYKNLVVLTKAQVKSIKNIVKACILSYYLEDAVLLNKADLAEKIKNHIRSNITTEITIKSLCDTFLLNTKQIYAIFKENFACTVKQYVLKERIEIAKDLLIKTNYSVTIVAEKSGFKDYNHFIQFFKSTTGETPYKYRKKRINI